MRIILTRPRAVELGGVMSTVKAGQTVDVGKMDALRWIEAGEATVAPPPAEWSPGAWWPLPPADSAWIFEAFALPAAWTRKQRVRQMNAIWSWQRYYPFPHVTLLGDDEGTRKYADLLGCRWGGEVARDEHGTPLVSHVFELGQTATDAVYTCYLNCDVIVVGLGPAFEACTQAFDAFLMVGRRWDLAGIGTFDFGMPGWEMRLWSMVERAGTLHAPGAVDWFAFKRGMWPLRSIPDFVVGRSAWDNWLVLDARRRGVPVVDATAVVLTVHQEHASAPMTPERREQRARNRALYDEARAGLPWSGSVKDADWRLTPGGLEKK